MLTLSRLQLSFKCHPGVLEDRMVPDTLTEYIIYFRIAFKTYLASFIQFWHEKPCEDSTCPPSLTFGGLDDRVILTPEVANGVSFKNIPCDRHSLVVFPGHLEPPVMRYHIWTCQFWDFKKVTVTQKRCIIEKIFIRKNFFKFVVYWTGDILAYSGPLKAF